MVNDPELNGKYLGTITRDFIKVADLLREASYQLRIRKISDFPIFIISREKLKIGQLLIGQNDKNLEWNYNFSFLENFIQMNIVSEEKREDFVSAYKNPEEFCCLFVIDNEFTNFVYVPYPED